MRPADVLRLVTLAAIWGSSFIFLRIVAPVLGPVMTANVRLLIAGVTLVIFFRWRGMDLGWRQHWRQYALIGAVNAALPFLFYSFAALHIPASLSVIFNATSPLFGAVFSALWLEEPLTPGRILGLLLGVGGVAVVSGAASLGAGPLAGWASVACLAAATCYALSGIYLKRFASHIPAMAMAGGSTLLAGAWILPGAAVFPIRSSVTLPVVGGILMLGLVCSALANLLYFRLISDVGPTKALTVTFLMPAFGILWGAIFLQEPVTLKMLGGCSLILVGIRFVVGGGPKSSVGPLRAGGPPDTPQRV